MEFPGNVLDVSAEDEEATDFPVTLNQGHEGQSNGHGEKDKGKADQTA